MISRRTLLKTSAAAGLTLTASGLAAPSIAQGAKIRLGYVSPQTGPLEWVPYQSRATYLAALAVVLCHGAGRTQQRS